MHPVDGVSIMRLAARPMARGQKFRQSHDDKPGPLTRSRRCRLLGGDGVRVRVRFRDGIRLQVFGRLLGGSRRPHQRGQPAGSDQQLLGGFRHVLLLHVRHPVSGLIADRFPHGVKNVRLGDTTEIGPHGRRQCAVMSSDTASANLSAVATARGLRSDGSLTALTVSATQCANSAMRLSWSSSTTKAHRSATSRGICAAQRAW